MRNMIFYYSGLTSMKNVLITGGSGLLGRYVVRALRHSYSLRVLDTVMPRAEVAYTRCDVQDFEAMLREVKHVEAVIHLAAIPHPLNHPPEEVVRVNCMGTFSVLEAAARNGVSTFILASSESTLGFAFMQRRMYPDYFPIDEYHPTRPQDPYGMSKLVSEQMCATYTRRFGMQTLCLRMPWIWAPEPEERVLYRRLIGEYHAWSKNLWAFVHVSDAAEAFRLALERPYKDEHDQWFVVADMNWTGLPSQDLVHEYYPESTVRKDQLTGTASLISNQKARRDLGFQPLRTAGDVFDEEQAL
jgi:UDP-glucose 4-epimerase